MIPIGIAGMVETQLLIGGIGSFAAQYLRRIIARAGIKVREQELFGKYRIVRRVAGGGMGEGRFMAL